MNYREFFQIEIIHDYFSGKPTDLVIIPDKQTKHLLEISGKENSRRNYSIEAGCRSK